MKRKYPLLICALILSGCGNSISSSTDTTKNPNSSMHTTDTSIGAGSESPLQSDSQNQGTDTGNMNFTAQDIYDLIKKAGDENNFTLLLSYEDEDGGILEYEFSYTDNYVDFGIMNRGYVSLADYADSSKKILYNYEKDENGNISVTNSLGYKNSEGVQTPVRSTTELNPFTNLLNEKTSDVFFNNTKYYATRDEDVITAFSYLMGVEDYVDAIAAVRFYVDNKYDDMLMFDFAPDFTSSSDYTVIDGVGGTLKFVGDTFVDDMDSFITSYSLPRKTLQEAQITGLGDTIAYDSTCTLTYNLSTGDKTIMDERLETVVSSEKKQTSRYYSDLENPTFTSYKKDSNGYAVQEYLSYENKVVENKTDSLFSDIVNLPKDVIDPLAFRSDDGSSYHYYGYDARNVLKKLGDIDIGALSSLDVTLKNGAINKITGVSELRSDSYAQTFQYKVEIEYTTSTFKTVEKLSNPSHYYKLQAILGKVYSDSYDLVSEYTMKTEKENSSAYPLYTHVLSSKGDGTIDTILYQQDEIDPAPGAYEEILTNYWGYFKASNGEIIPFRVRDDMTTVSTAESITDKTRLNQVLGMDISLALFSKATEKSDRSTDYSIDSFAYDVSDHVLGGDNKRRMIPSSYTVNATNYNLNYIEYEFNGYDLFTGKEKITFLEKQTLPTIDYSTLAPFVVPTDWKDGAPEVYDLMVEILGEGVAKNIPFLYNKDMAGNWGGDTYEDLKEVALYNTTYAASLENDDLSFTYMKEYEALLREKGFTDYPFPVDGKAGLKKDGLYVRIGDRGMSGIRFCID